MFQTVNKHTFVLVAFSLSVYKRNVYFTLENAQTNANNFGLDLVNTWQKI